MNNSNDSEHRRLLKAKLRNKMHESRYGNTSAATASHSRPDLCATLLEQGIDDANLLQLAQNLNVDKLRNVVSDMKRAAKGETSAPNDEEAPPPES